VAGPGGGHPPVGEALTGTAGQDESRSPPRRHAATPPAERHSLPALMAAARLREDRWLVHYLATDLPVAEVIGLALDVGADLVVLSSATAQTARASRRAAREIGFSAPWLRVPVGRPGDTLGQLLTLARSSRGPH
jgi:hypothetical protein